MWLNPFKPKKSPERDLQELTHALQAGAGPRLKSVVLFGSMASEEFQNERSDINVLALFDDVDAEIFHSIGPALKKWLEKGHVPPILLGQKEVATFAQVFPIEFLDMQDHHRVLYGENPLTGLKVDTAHLRFQCRHELSLHFLKLRQAIAAGQGNAKKVRPALVHSLPSVLTLFRAILRLEGPIPKLKKIEAAERLAKKIGFDPSCLRRINDLHIHRQADNLEDLANLYLQTIEKVLWTRSKEAM